jgi:Ca2+-binding RTX toxin-like protein
MFTSSPSNNSFSKLASGFKKSFSLHWIKLVVTLTILGAHTLVLLSPRPAEAFSGKIARRGALVRPVERNHTSQIVDKSQMPALIPRLSRFGQSSGQSGWLLDPLAAGDYNELTLPHGITDILATDFYTYTFTTNVLSITIDSDPEGQTLALSCESGSLSIDSTIDCNEIQSIYIEDITDTDSKIDLNQVRCANPGGANPDFCMPDFTVTVVGGPGSDDIIGSHFNDTIYGDTQDDLYVCVDPIYGCADAIKGGEGDDYILAGPGDDAIEGEYGNDMAIIGSGKDTISGGEGIDTFEYQSGLDLNLGISIMQVGQGSSPITTEEKTYYGVEIAHLIGDDSPNRMNGSAFPGSVFMDAYGDKDTLTGSAQSDTLLGGSGDDLLTGNAGDDFLQGDIANDTLLGGSGTDTLQGDDGNDLFTSGTDGYEDSLIGGAGLDTLRESVGVAYGLTLSDSELYEQYSGSSIYNSVAEIEVAEITGSDLEDNIDASGFSGTVTLNGGAGNDSLAGGAGDDYIYSTSGNNLMSGNQGDDIIIGGEGLDSLYGGPGSDELDGYNEDDYLYGGPDADTLIGNEGNDHLYGQAGNDSLVGGRGNDSLFGGDQDDVLLMQTDGVKLLSGDAGNDQYNFPFFVETGSHRVVTIQEPDNPGEIDTLTYYASNQSETLRLRNEVLSRKLDRIILSPYLEDLHIYAMSGNDDFEIYPSKTITYSVDGGGHINGDTLEFHTPPGETASESTTAGGEHEIWASHNAPVLYVNIESQTIIQELWQVLLALIRR